jgi:hypothetical protein
MLSESGQAGHLIVRMGGSASSVNQCGLCLEQSIGFESDDIEAMKCDKFAVDEKDSYGQDRWPMSRIRYRC